MAVLQYYGLNVNVILVMVTCAILLLLLLTLFLLCFCFFGGYLLNWLLISELDFTIPVSAICNKCSFWSMLEKCCLTLMFKLHKILRLFFFWNVSHTAMDGSGSGLNGERPCPAPVKGGFGSGFLGTGRVWDLLT